MCSWLRFEGTDYDTLVKRVPRHDLPVVEHGEAECLALRVGAEVGLEAEGVDGGEEGLDGVERRAGHWGVLGHMASGSEYK